MTECAPIERMLRQSIGFDVESIGRGAFEKIVRAARSCAGSCAACQGELRANSDAFAELVEQLVVPETWFFRDGEPFVYLAEAMCERGAKGPPRILSVPCSTGEEPYSIAMTLLDAGVERFAIDAVDVSRRALAAAGKGWYGASSFRGERRDRHFVECEGGCQVNERVAAAVRFREGNLCAPDFLAGEEPYDAIFCRNVLIYMAPEARKTVLGHVRRLLVPDGLVFTGHAEMAVFLGAGYIPVPHRGAFACRRERRAARRVHRVSAKSGAAKGTRADQGARPAVPEDLLARARRMADRGDLEQASALCDRVLRHGRANVEACYLKGLIELACGRMDGAEEWLRKTLYLEPGHYEALLQMSTLAAGRGDSRGGALFLERARRAGGKRENERG